MEASTYFSGSFFLWIFYFSRDKGIKLDIFHNEEGGNWLSIENIQFELLNTLKIQR